MFLTSFINFLHLITSNSRITVISSFYYSLIFPFFFFLLFLTLTSAALPGSCSSSACSRRRVGAGSAGFRTTQPASQVSRNFKPRQGFSFQDSNAPLLNSTRECHRGQRILRKQNSGPTRCLFAKPPEDHQPIQAGSEGSEVRPAAGLTPKEMEPLQANQMPSKLN